MREEHWGISIDFAIKDWVGVWGVSHANATLRDSPDIIQQRIFHRVIRARRFLPPFPPYFFFLLFFSFPIMTGLASRQRFFVFDFFSFCVSPREFRVPNIPKILNCTPGRRVNKRRTRRSATAQPLHYLPRPFRFYVSQSWCPVGSALLSFPTSRIILSQTRQMMKQKMRRGKNNH